MLDTQFDRQRTPGSLAACINPCRAAKAGDDQLSRSVATQIQAYTGRPEATRGIQPGDGGPVLLSADDSACKKKAATLGPTLRRFNRYREAEPYARAANDMNKMGDELGARPPKGSCLTRLPETGAELCKALGKPEGSITDDDLRDPETGFRAALYRDEATGQVILVGRDTRPTSLVDWQTNTRNGDGKDTDQYAAMRDLSGRLRQLDVPFNVAGYSKGGGLAQEAALVNPDAKAYVFNAAGLHQNSLARTGATDFRSLEARTQSFSAEGDFLTYMNQTKDPDQQIRNVKFLRAELAGENRPLIKPMKIDDPDQQAVTEYMKELDEKIATMERDRAAGKPLQAFPPVRAGQHETVPGSMSTTGKLAGARSDGPSLGKLAQHQMDNVLEPMQSNIEKDRKALYDFVASCGLKQAK